MTGEFPAQKASNAENVSIWWRHDEHITDAAIPFLIGDYQFTTNFWVSLEYRCLMVERLTEI